MACSFEWSFNSWSSPRPSTEKEIVSGAITRKFDILSFLSVAQALQIRFVGINWDVARQEIGGGGSSRVNEGVANIQASFAFKRVREKSERDAGIFQTLTNEITVLGHDAIRAHPNIVQLQGISWDIPREQDRPWPVLIFEKAELGDLFEFTSSNKGRKMRIEERLKLCIDIGVAIMDMHLNSK